MKTGGELLNPGPFDGDPLTLPDKACPWVSIQSNSKGTTSAITVEYTAQSRWNTALP